jgi:hypothetical protein
MNHLINILYVVAGLLIYEKAVKPMLDKDGKPAGNTLEDDFS